MITGIYLREVTGSTPIIPIGWKSGSNRFIGSIKLGYPYTSASDGDPPQFMWSIMATPSTYTTLCSRSPSVKSSMIKPGHAYTKD